MRKRQRQNLLPHSALFTDGGIRSLCHPTPFFRAPRSLTIDYDELFDVTTEDPTEFYSEGTSSGPSKRLRFFSRPKYWEMFCHYNNYMCTRERVCAQSCSLVIVQLACTPAPSLLRHQEIREPEEWGASQVPARGLFVSFLLIYGSKSRAVPSKQDPW